MPPIKHIFTRRLFIGTGASALCGGFGGFPGVALAFEPTTKTLADDVAILREALLTLHPGLYRYLSPKQAELELAAFETSFLSAPDQAARFLALSRLLATIRCGHSYANFYNQKKAVKTELFDRKTRLPFAFQWIDDRMVITADHGSGANLAPGTIVEKINGVSAKKILQRLMPYVRADGSNDAKRRALLAVTSDHEFETFDIFYGLIFGAPETAMHRLDIRRPGGSTVTVAVPPITLAQRQSFRRIPPASNDQPMWQWDMRPDGIAVLTMDSWGTYKTKWDWRAWLEERLNTLNGARGLIVDIRKNEGGENCGDPILARFIKTDIPLGEEKQLVRFRTTPKSIDPYLDTWDDSFRTLGVAADPYDDRFFRLKRSAEDGVIAARAPRSDVPMIVLIGPTNSSATFQFAARCKKAGIATLMGEPSGGNQRGINGGRFFFVRLPASGLEFDLPLIGSFPTLSAPDAGLLPDIIVQRRVEDIAASYDRAMAAAIKKLSGKKRFSTSKIGG